MSEYFEEGLGRYTYITLPQIKDYLSISSNTQDARLSNIVSYATSVIEHYIGQEILANNYTEVFDGGSSSIFVSRLPLSNVYSVTEYTGSENIVLADPPVDSGYTINKTVTTFNPISNAFLTTIVKKFGESSLKVLANASVSAKLPSSFAFDEGSFTIECYVRSDAAYLQNTSVITISKDSENYIDIGLANAYGAYYTVSLNNSTSTITGANSLIESQQYQKRRWAHLAITRDADNELLYIHYNGNTIANASTVIDELSFSNSLSIAGSFIGYIDELRVSSIPRYTTDFIPYNNRFRPDKHTNLLLHFEGLHESTKIVDDSSVQADYTFAKDTGEIIKASGLNTTRRASTAMKSAYESLSLGGQPIFAPYPNGVTVSYRAGYELGKVPLDLQLVTLDYIKTLYKQDQERKSFSLEGESAQPHALSGNFPPHIRKVLDLYRIIK